MKKPEHNHTIISNRRARHDYFIEEQFEAGIILEGWEVKSLREKRGNLNESYVIAKNNEVWLLGLHLSPLLTASTHIKPDPTRTRKLLLHRKQINRLRGLIERKGYTLVPLSLYWSRGRAKCEIALVKGKKQHDKRAAEKDRDWERQKGRILKNS